MGSVNGTCEACLESMGGRGRKYHRECAKVVNLIKINGRYLGGCFGGPKYRRETATFEWFLRKLAETGNICPVCRWEFSANRDGTPCIDHEPGTGKLRGVICYACNSRLTKSGDENLNRIPGARAYLSLPEPRK